MPFDSNIKNIEEIILSIEMICSKQEKCKSEIREKLKKWELPNEKIEDILSLLEKENFINEIRYTEFYIKDKLKFNKWGKIKLKYYLKQKQIPKDIIQDGLDNIDEIEYFKILKSEIEKKLKLLTSKNQRKDKLVRYAQSKGFEPELIFSIVNEKIKNY